MSFTGAGNLFSITDDQPVLCAKKLAEIDCLK